MPGWIVYEQRTGRMEKYYKKAATAKRIVTQHNTPREYDWGPIAGTYRYEPREIWACCSYRDYEGVLMGLRGEQLKMWQFCNTEIG